jgi:opacity protein-like surface antigen
MRTLVLALALGMTASGATAQSEQHWDGAYAGAAFNAQAEASGDFKTIIDPGLDARLIYTVLPPETSFSADPFDRSVAPVLFAGWRRELGGWFFGAEGQVQVGGPRARLDSGFITTEFLPFVNCSSSGFNCLRQTSDRIETDVQVRNVLALRATVGRPVGDRVLLSAYGGPAIASARVAILQTSTYGTFQFDQNCQRFCISQSTAVTETRGGTENDTALGVVVGVTGDVRITDDVHLRGDLGYQRFEAFRESTGASNGGDSEIRAQSDGLAAGLGLTFKF